MILYHGSALSIENIAIINKHLKYIGIEKI